MDNFHGKHMDRMRGRGEAVFPHMETWIHVSVDGDMFFGEEQMVSVIIKHATAIDRRFFRVVYSSSFRRTCTCAAAAAAATGIMSCSGLQNGAWHSFLINSYSAHHLPLEIQSITCQCFPG